MKKTMLILCTLIAAAVQAARVTSTDGRTITADVVSYADGVFVLRSGDREVECPQASIASIEFEPTKFEPTEDAADEVDDIKIDIRKATVNFSREGDRDYYWLKPSVRIDCRAIVQEFRQRPLVVLRLKLLESKTKTIKPSICWYDWEENRGWRQVGGQNQIDLSEISSAQPQCDWEKLSPITLDCYDTVHPGIGLSTRHTVAAFRTEVWLGGRLVTAENQRKGWNTSLPEEWK